MHLEQYCNVTDGVKTELLARETCPNAIVKGKGKGHPCTGTEALYRPYGP